MFATFCAVPNCALLLKLLQPFAKQSFARVPAPPTLSVAVWPLACAIGSVPMLEWLAGEGSVDTTQLMSVRDWPLPRCA